MTGDQGGDRDGLPAEHLVRFLQGAWLGHPLHPALSDIPIGTWAASLALDGAGLVVKRDRGGWHRAADVTLATTVASGGPTVLTGMADLMTRTRGASRTLACLHGCLQCMALMSGAASVVARVTGFRHTGIGLSVVGYALLLAGAWLGGELVFRHGVGVVPSDPRPARAIEPAVRTVAP